ncbi:MAG: phosphate ABC transporter permease subunit PstC, partial [Pseudomonadota bacterium]
LIVVLLTAAAFLTARSRATMAAGGDYASLHSRPGYHGLYSALWVGLTGFAVIFVIALLGAALIESRLMGAIFDADPTLSNIQAELVLSDAIALASGDIASQSDALRLSLSERYASMETMRLWAVLILGVGAAGAAFFLTQKQIAVAWRARNRSERIIVYVLLASAIIAILTTIGIVLSLIGETVNFFGKIDWRLFDYLFGLNWSPLSGVQAGKMDPEKVGAIPLFAGTMMITLIAMLVATPIGLLAAIYLSDFASPAVRGVAKPMLEILAGIPTVVYGFFAALTVGPFIRGMGESIGLTVASESALAAGIVMGIMIIPFISSLSDDVINSVPQSLRDGSYGLGATKAETIRQVVLPAALPGVVSAVLLGVSRAIGETMIVVMAAGQGANLTANPLEAVTTVTVQIVMLITGDTDAATAAGPAFTLGFTLFCVTLGLNFVALRIVRRYREMYD